MYDKHGILMDFWRINRTKLSTKTIIHVSLNTIIIVYFWKEKHTGTDVTLTTPRFLKVYVGRPGQTTHFFGNDSIKLVPLCRCPYSRKRNQKKKTNGMNESRSQSTYPDLISANGPGLRFFLHFLHRTFHCCVEGKWGWLRGWEVDFGVFTLYPSLMRK